MPDELPTQPGLTPPPEPVPATTPVSSVSEPLAPSGSGLTPNVAAGLAAVFTVIGGVVMLVIEKKDRFVRFWAMQSVFFGVAWIVFVFAASFIGMILNTIFHPLAVLWSMVYGLGELGLLVVWIISIVQAFSGKEWEMPVLGKLARQQLAKVTPLP